jgi:hypothetical protein
MLFVTIKFQKFGFYIIPSFFLLSWGHRLPQRSRTTHASSTSNIPSDYVSLFYVSRDSIEFTDYNGVNSRSFSVGYWYNLAQIVPTIFSSKWMSVETPAGLGWRVLDRIWLNMYTEKVLTATINLTWSWTDVQHKRFLYIGKILK